MTPEAERDRRISELTGLLAEAIGTDGYAMLPPADRLRKLADLLEGAPTTDQPSVDPRTVLWPERIRVSASLLKQNSSALSSYLEDERVFSTLTDSRNSTTKALADLQEFERLVVATLASLIDLTAVDSPDRPYPELEPWFEFTCENANFGRRRETTRLERDH